MEYSDLSPALGTIIIYGRDMQKTAAFYRKHFGFKPSGDVVAAGYNVRAFCLALMALAACRAPADEKPLDTANTLACVAYPESLFPDSTVRHAERWYGKHLRAAGAGS